ncbi:MAG: DUF309 domain-containing protein [Planctomycetes bacterium]|nr:DUF309 domain-containing protein [Planctomycetota bacterium]
MMEYDVFSQLHSPRYSRLSFPPYRYIPGQNPHPVANPAGHSFRAAGMPEPHVPFVPSERWRESDLYLYGCDLYNHGYWWEAHEAWEGLWHHPEKGSAQKEFLQGLIQVSACHLNLYLGRMDGVARLRRTSFEHFERATSQLTTANYMGLEVREFMSRVASYYSGVLGSSLAVHCAKTYPYVLVTL